MREIKFEIKIGDVLQIETDKKTLFLKVSCIAAEGDNSAHYIEAQAINKKKCRLIEIKKHDKLPKGWEASSYRRFKFAQQ